MGISYNYNAEAIACMKLYINFRVISKWAFIIGLVIAVLAGLFFQPAWAIWVLAILGVIVGLLSVTVEDTRGFLLAAISLTLSAH